MFFLAYSYSAGTQQGNLHPALRAYTGTGVNHSNTEKKSGEVGTVEISQEKIPGSKRGMYGYILAYPRL